jgi:hypothetical protein
MTQTEIQLLALYRKVAIPLDRVAADYLGIGTSQAMRLATLNQLPFPTMRMTDSRKAPYAVRISDLAAYLDKLHEGASQSWQNSQV